LDVPGTARLLTRTTILSVRPKTARDFEEGRRLTVTAPSLQVPGRHDPSTVGRDDPNLISRIGLKVRLYAHVSLTDGYLDTSGM